MSEVLPGPFRAGHDNTQERDSGSPQPLARGSELADVTPAERTVQAAEHREQDRTATAILCERHGSFDIGCRQFEVWRPFARTQRTMPGISHLLPPRSLDRWRESLVPAANARYHPRPKAVGWMPLLAVLEPPLITVFTLRHLDYYLILFGIEVVVASMFALS